MSLQNAYDEQHRINREKFFAGTCGLVEANSYENMKIWEDIKTSKHYTYKSLSEGWFEQVGTLADMPVTVSMFASLINGHKVIFWESPSTVVDHRLIAAYFKEHLPKTSYRSGGEYLNQENAMNAFNVFHRLEDKVDV